MAAADDRRPSSRHPAAWFCGAASRAWSYALLAVRPSDRLVAALLALRVRPGARRGAASHWPLFLWLLLGAIAMRGAGCVYNDIVDRNLDAQVARTASRPVASGAVSVRNAGLWMVLLALVGLFVLLQLPRPAQIVALASLLLVAAYPFMKRITWWPQAWLGLVFSWGALVAWVAVGGREGLALPLLYAGCIAWVVGYDTIYALQDIEDDMLVGVKSSARGWAQVHRGCLCYVVARRLGGRVMGGAPDPLALVARSRGGAFHRTGCDARSDNGATRSRSSAATVCLRWCSRRCSWSEWRLRLFRGEQLGAAEVDRDETVDPFFDHCDPNSRCMGHRHRIVGDDQIAGVGFARHAVEKVAEALDIGVVQWRIDFVRTQIGAGLVRTGQR